MPSVPYPITAEDLQDIRRQLSEIIREVFEDRIGGLYLGDVFQDSGDVLTVTLAVNGGLEKDAGLKINLKDNIGLQLTSDGLSTKLKASGGLAVDASGLYSDNPTLKQDHIVDAVSSHAVTDPGAPTGCVGLQADLVANTIPSMETQLNNLGIKINAILKALEDANILKVS